MSADESSVISSLSSILYGESILCGERMKTGDNLENFDKILHSKNYIREITHCRSGG